MRPPLPEGRRRTRRKELTLSPAEWTMIEDRARAAGVSPTRYIRDAALTAGLVGDADAIRSAKRPKTGQMATGVTRELVAAINRIGNNLNQLARVANETDRLPREAEFDAVRDELMTHLAQLLGVSIEDASGLKTPRKARAHAPGGDANVRVQ